MSYVKRNNYVSLCKSVKFNLFDLLRVLYSEGLECIIFSAINSFVIVSKFSILCLCWRFY